MESDQFANVAVAGNLTTQTHASNIRLHSLYSASQHWKKWPISQIQRTTTIVYRLYPKRTKPQPINISSELAPKQGSDIHIHSVPVNSSLNSLCC